MIHNLNLEVVEYTPAVRLITVERVHPKQTPLIDSSGLSVYNETHLNNVRRLIAQGLKSMTVNDAFNLSTAHPVLAIEAITAIYAKFGFVRYYHPWFCGGDQIIQTQWEK